MNTQSIYDHMDTRKKEKGFNETIEGISSKLPIVHKIQYLVLIPIHVCICIQRKHTDPLQFCRSNPAVCAACQPVTHGAGSPAVFNQCQLYISSV